jgi:hypothetical protein
MSTVRTESPLLSWKKIYLCYRRFDKSGVATNIVEAYNINNNSSLLMPTARHGLATVFIDDDNIKYI